MRAAFRSSRVKGFSLLELILFIVIVSVGLAGVLTVFTNSVRSSSDPMILKQVTLIAEATMNEIMQKSFSNTSLDSVGCTGATTPSCNSNSWTDRPNYNDVDDYNGFSKTGVNAGIRQIDGTTAVTGLESYTLQVTVTGTALGPAGSVITAANAKQITVTVTGGGQTITLIGFRTNYE
jgi:MSHA pilin protein MshD